jgi:hypothetical protein
MQYARERLEMPREFLSGILKGRYHSAYLGMMGA